jgi:hypothetical protein
MNCILLIEFLAHVSTRAREGKFITMNTCILITLVNTQNVSAAKLVDSSSIQYAETKYGLRIQFLALVVMINEVCLNA